MLRFLAVLMTLVLAASCGPGLPTYQDRVRPLPADRVSPLLAELLPLLDGKSPQEAADLIRTWKEYLGENQVPLRKDLTVTFVYYDFTGTLSAVALEASFAPGRQEPLGRYGSTGLFYRTYEIPRPDKMKYRYLDGSTPLPDPFHADIDPGEGLWHQGTGSAADLPATQWVVGASENLLAGQDLRILVPPLYKRNLAQTYPLVVVVGVPDDGWAPPLSRLLEEEAIRPIIVVSVGTRPGPGWTLTDLKTTLEDRVVPWLRDRYRVSPYPSDLVLVGMGPSAKLVQDLATARPDFWTKVWTTLEVPFIRAQFPVKAVNP